MTPKKAVLHFWDLYKEALRDKTIVRPIAYALYHTWKWVDENEPSKRGKGGDRE